jgi:hypothetical protein
VQNHDESPLIANDGRITRPAVTGIPRERNSKPESGGDVGPGRF